MKINRIWRTAPTPKPGASRQPKFRRASTGCSFCAGTRAMLKRAARKVLGKP